MPKFPFYKAWLIDEACFEVFAAQRFFQPGKLKVFFGGAPIEDREERFPGTVDQDYTIEAGGHTFKLHLFEKRVRRETRLDAALTVDRVPLADTSICYDLMHKRTVNWRFRLDYRAHHLRVERPRHRQGEFPIKLDKQEVGAVVLNDVYARDITRYDIPIGRNTASIYVTFPKIPGEVFFSYTLTVNRQLVRPGENPAITAPPAPREELAPPPVQVQVSEGQLSMVPKLPPACPHCGAPLNFQNAKWTGPASAACPACGEIVPVTWEQVG